jgi:hypothetical protein
MGNNEANGQHFFADLIFQTYETSGQHSEIFGIFLWQFFSIYPLF